MAAKRSLVVVESPTKVKTIQKYLDQTYVVKASLGHVKDLPANKLGVDVEKNFKPQYVTLKTKAKVLDELKKAAKNAQALYVATDPDREGEAIGWHVASELKIPADRVYRVLFNEITEKAVKAAFARPGKIDQKKVDAQQARRVLDRLVGYKISPLLWERVRRGLSAGRVQSVAVRLVVERERAIRAFVPQEYWSLHAHLTAAVPPEFVATLREKAGQRVDLRVEADARAVMAGVEGLPFVVEEVARGERRKNPAPPFITSTLQQEAARKLGFSASKTMMVAQQLYEGVEIGADGAIGLITYMRTDSPRVAPDAQGEARQVIAARYGSQTLPERPPVYRARKSAQEAHEAIRPTLVDRGADELVRYLTRDQLALYRLIWGRFLASQMRPAVYDTLTVDVAAGLYRFRAQGSALREPGFMAVYIEAPDESARPPEDEEGEVAGLPPLEAGQRLGLVRLEPKQHFTQPPPRYTEASLVKELEEKGIGRPSTYAQILSTIQKRGYVKRDRGALSPTDLGEVVTDLLVEAFPDLLEVAFTAQMEESLDEVEEGERKWVETVRDYYSRFAKDLKRAHRDMDDLKKGKRTDETCPQCGEGQLLERWGRFGRFLACERYPDCKYTRNVGDNGQPVEPQPAGIDCPACGKPMVFKEGRFGRFIACSGYPECKTTRPITIGIACPQEGCGGELTERRSKRGKPYYGCANYPACKFVVWQRPVGSPCPKCAAPFLLVRASRGKRYLACWREGCDYRREADEA
ncbi:MAG: type I DNA topoisomerase [Candidatus Rokubacteria bacterium]|nr:type I DNA topoisomerase [Candidatus Rokubacteria bacterium]